MGVIIRMNSKDFLDKFIKKFDYKDYRFLLISEAIKSKKHENAYPLSCLIPPTNAISEFIANGYSEKYVKKYVQHLQQPKMDLLISTIVRMAVVENRNVVLLCSESEDDYKFLKILGNYIEATHELPVYTYKKYIKDPSKCEEIKGKKKLTKKINKRITKLSEDPRTRAVTDNKQQFIKKLKNADKDELKAYCKENSIKVKKDDSKKDIIKRILSVID